MGYIRLATEEDAEGILHIYRSYIIDSAVSFETVVPTVDEMAKRIRHSLDSHCWLVWEEQEQLGGYAYACQHHPRAAYRWAVDVSIYIGESQQGKGLGKRLYAALFAILRRQGYANAYSCICLPHPKSVGIHEYFGFKKVAHFNKVGYKLDQWWDVGWWELSLLEKEIDPVQPISLSALDPSETGRILGEWNCK